MIKPSQLHTPLLLTLTAILLFAMGGCGTASRYFNGEVSLAMSQDVAGYAVVGGEHYGFGVEVADTIARTMNSKLRVLPRLTTSAIREGLERGDIDIALVPRSERVLLHDFPSESFYTTGYVFLMPSWTASKADVYDAEMWRGKRLLTDSHFRDHATYKEFVQNGILCDTARLDGIEMARRVMAGRADALVCERSEAELVKFLYRSLSEVVSIEEECEVILIFGSRKIKEDFTARLTTLSASEYYATLADLYFGERSIAERFTQLKYRPTRVVGGISVWDTQLRTIAKQVGVDWRLMSAMAYHESRFRNDQVSHKGAVGLMQVTPIAAEDLGADEGYDLADPSTNISLAARLLRRNSRALGFGNFPSTDDQIAIVVASYNCGITRTIEAQRLVVAAGGNGSSWDEISAMMTNMSCPEWIATSDYRMRRFGDAPVTIAYTNAVMALYDTYRSAIN
ncbi:MAG: transglycosylase SLT domain-containing protein [Tidjanibacter sp.]|nr:transglycosylase SLT domain-containing protein [Tidjanibacter sp.]